MMSSSQHFIINRYLLLATSVGAACASVVAMHVILQYLEAAWPDLVASMHWLLLGMIFLLSEWVGAGYVLMTLGLVSVLLFKLTYSPLLGVEYSVRRQRCKPTPAWIQRRSHNVLAEQDETWETMVYYSRWILGTYAVDWVRNHISIVAWRAIIGRSIFPPGADRAQGMETMCGNEKTGAPDVLLNFTVSNWKRSPDSRVVDNVCVDYHGFTRTDRNRYSEDEQKAVIEGWGWKRGRLVRHNYYRPLTTLYRVNLTSCFYRQNSSYRRRWFSLNGSVMYYSDSPNGRHLGSFSVHGAKVQPYLAKQVDDDTGQPRPSLTLAEQGRQGSRDNIRVGSDVSLEVVMPHRRWVIRFSEDDVKIFDRVESRRTEKRPVQSPPGDYVESPAVEEVSRAQQVRDLWVTLLNEASREHKEFMAEVMFDTENRKPMTVIEAVALSSTFLTTGTGDYGEWFGWIDRIDKSFFKAIGWDMGYIVIPRGQQVGIHNTLARAFLAWLPWSVFLVGLVDESAGNVAVLLLVIGVALLAPVADLIDERTGNKLPVRLPDNAYVKRALRFA